jgi:hypothetical protein
MKWLSCIVRVAIGLISPHTQAAGGDSLWRLYVSSVVPAQLFSPPQNKKQFLLETTGGLALARAIESFVTVNTRPAPLGIYV